MKKYAMIAAALLAVACASAGVDPASVEDAAGQVSRVEPLSWWVGMKTDLQLMVQGPEISTYDVSVSGPGVKVTGVHPADSPNYLFVDVEVGPAAKPGTCYLIFSRDGVPAFKYAYQLQERREGSAARTSFSTSDLIYLVMPDRFADGDPTNENSFSTAVPSYTDGSLYGWTIPALPDQMDRKDPVARHGGDIQGMIDHLDYMADLGVTAIWATPLLLDNQPYETYHGYACADYYHIDPRFGDNALYKKFVEAAHEKDIKVIMDIVTNHCGTAHWWMEDPPFKDWYHVTEPYMQMNALFSAYNDDHAAQCDRDRQESGWFVPSMPDMNLDNPYLLKYFQQWAVWWVEYANLDGLRVDTYPYNEPGPMSQWCKAVLNEYPNLNIVGECWDYFLPQVAYWQKDNPNRDGFNSNLPTIMDFPLERAIHWGLCEDYVNWDEGIIRVYTLLAHDWVYHDTSHLMTFFANHDHARIGDSFHGDSRRMKLALAMLATIRGIPQLYYGDEMMFVERKDCISHDGAKRIDFPGGWAGDRTDLFSEEGRAAATGMYANAKDLYDYTRTLFQWRKGCKAVQDGKTLHFLSRKNEGDRNYTDNTYAFFRYTEDQAVFVYINNTLEERSLDWGHYNQFVSGPVKGYSVLDGCEITLQDGVTIPAKSALVVEFPRGE
ncbi:MAG: cyclomaltodextrinase N-terminal domain-containing protein [Bacteroidales bacterium]|nr:cyclomaltodextrinase N-terminal domain-containing protein [Bacteroidales bacterium]